MGADNGIGIAIILAILNSNRINHPRIEAIFTVQEETTMQGAKQIDVSKLDGKKMICLDNMNEEELWIGCAAAKIFEYIIKGNIHNVNSGYMLIKIGINGFRGGHSGKDISKNRGNPIKEMGNLLSTLDRKYNIFLKNIFGGRKVNVIPRECYCEIYIKYEDFCAIKQEIISFKRTFEEFNDNDDIMVTINEIQETNDECFDSYITKKIINIIRQIPNGVYYEDKYSNPLVSLNIGKIENNSHSVKIAFSIRSNRVEVEEKLEKELENIINKYKVQLTKSELSGYEHKEKSIFIENCKEIYRQFFQRNPKVIDMHICLEAGFFGEKISGLDFIAIAPNIYDAHSPKERCSIESLEKVFNYIVRILNNF